MRACRFSVSDPSVGERNCASQQNRYSLARFTARAYSSFARVISFSSTSRRAACECRREMSDFLIHKSYTHLLLLRLGLWQRADEVLDLLRLDHYIRHEFPLIFCPRILVSLVQRFEKHHPRVRSAPSKTSGESYFSGGRAFVTGTSGLTCTKFAREVRYAMLLDIIVRSWDDCVSTGTRKGVATRGEPTHLLNLIL